MSHIHRSRYMQYLTIDMKMEQPSPYPNHKIMINDETGQTNDTLGQQMNFLVKKEIQ
jgi:hypothetical protein